MSVGMTMLADLPGLSRANLQARVVALTDEVAALKARISELQQLVAAQRDEIAHLKGLKGRPVIRPSGMENATERKHRDEHGKNRGRGPVVPRVVIEIQVVRVKAVPPGSEFKGYESYHMQELVITARVRAIAYGIGTTRSHIALGYDLRMAIGGMG